MYLAKKDVKQWKRWFIKNKKSIEWDKHIEKGLLLISEFNSTTNLDETVSISKELESRK